MTQGAGTRRAIALAVRAGIVAVIAFALIAGPIDSSEKVSDTASIATYDVKFGLQANGDLSSIERIGVDFPSGKRGIFRIFDVKDPRGGPDHPVSGVVVARDGNGDEPWVWQKKTSKTKTIRIGDENVYLEPGRHDYVIAHRTENTLERGKDGTVVWWWDVVGSGWQMRMEEVSVTASLPADGAKVECVRGEGTPCEATIDGRELSLRASSLAPYTPITVRVTFPAGALPEPPAGNSALIAWLIAIACGLLGAGAAWYLVSGTRETAPGFPVVFEPPPAVRPALAARVLYEADAEDDLQATLYDLAERQVIRLEGNEAGWTITLLLAPPAEMTNSAEARMLRELGLMIPGQSFTVVSSETSGEKLHDARETLRAAVGDEVRPYLQTSGAGILVKLLGSLAAVTAVGLPIAYVFAGWPSLWPLTALAAGFALIAAGTVIDPGSDTKHTTQGTDTWSRTGGFARFLSTESSESRFNAAEHLDWYPKYLPWATAFGAASAWAGRYETQGVPAPEVPWIYWSGSGDFGGARGFAAMTGSFESAISSAVDSYEAAQSASSGGGFSGGSGGGGGGGGSW
ncbi:MAG: DUF2207 domain-containing protein [Baekduia sp.]